MKTRETMRTREEINSPMLMEREAAKYLRINNSTLADLRKYGFINSLDLGARKYPKWELDRFISKWTDSQESMRMLSNKPSESMKLRTKRSSIYRR